MAYKKNGFLTFLCSLLPGAGEMYLGFMKQGLSLMTLFFGIIAFCAFFGFEAGLFILPIIWFYSFFHVHNLNGLPDEEFHQVEDDYLFHLPEMENSFQLTRKKELLIAYGCIIIGIYALCKLILDTLSDLIPWSIYEQIDTIAQILPQSLLSLLLIAAGIHLIRGKKSQIDQQEKEELEKEKNCEEKKDQTSQPLFSDDFPFKNE